MLLADYPSRGGKLMRPTLLMCTARAFGASLDRTLGAAVSLEMLHNALLIHDDIEDYSEQRRGRAALHVEHGLPLALCAGDALALGSLKPLLDSHSLLGPRLTLRLLEETDKMSQESAEGQALELGWRYENIFDIGEADYLEMVLKKTCWTSFIYPLRIGAMIAHEDLIDLDPFIRLGFFLGAAFQIQDDVLNLKGDDDRYGKEADGDLWEGKRTLMLIHLLRHAEREEAEEIRRIMSQSREDKTADRIAWIRKRMEVHGCLEYAEKISYGMAGSAYHEYESSFGHLPPSDDKKFVEALVSWVVRRSI